MENTRNDCFLKIILSKDKSQKKDSSHGNFVIKNQICARNMSKIFSHVNIIYEIYENGEEIENCAKSLKREKLCSSREQILWHRTCAMTNEMSKISVESLLRWRISLIMFCLKEAIWWIFHLINLINCKK